MNFKLIILFYNLFSYVINAQDCNGGNDADVVKYLPGWGQLDDQISYSGFIEVNKTANGSLFYWFFEALDQSNYANKTNIPVLVWLNGGPGASSLTGLFDENGPFRLQADLTLQRFEYSWNKHYHMLFVDNPIGTGFSYCNDDGYVTNENQVGEQFAIFLQKFLNECHPKYKNNPLYITGESYAGRYIPFIANWTWIYNQEYNYQIPLKGLVIGNGIYDPFIQFQNVGHYAYNLGIIDDKQLSWVQTQVNACLTLAQKGINLTYAADLCVNSTNDIYSVFGGNIFQYNIYVLNGDAFDSLDSQLALYLNQSDIPYAIHTNGEAFKSSDGTTVPNPVYDNLKYDIVVNNSALFIPYLLNEYRILFYNGQLDGSICNNYGNALCLNQLNYKGEWTNLNKTVWYREENNVTTTCGYVKRSSDKKLTYFVVSDSGHLVPLDQPVTALSMITNWIEDRDWNTTSC